MLHTSKSSRKIHKSKQLLSRFTPAPSQHTREAGVTRKGSWVWLDCGGRSMLGLASAYPSRSRGKGRSGQLWCPCRQHKMALLTRAMWLVAINWVSCIPFFCLKIAYSVLGGVPARPYDPLSSFSAPGFFRPGLIAPKNVEKVSDGLQVVCTVFGQGQPSVRRSLGCTAFTNVGAGTTAIEAHAFEGCTEMRNVSLPSTLTRRVCWTHGLDYPPSFLGVSLLTTCGTARFSPPHAH